MKQYQVNKLKEDWWDDMDEPSQAQYIKDHPGSKQAKDAGGDDEDDYDMGVVPGSRELDDTPEDDSEKGSSLTSAPGRVPDEDKPFEPKTSPEGKASRQAVGDTRQGAVQSGMAKKSAEKELKVAEQGVEDAGMFGKGKAQKALADAQEKVTSTTSADDAAQAEYQKAKGAQDARQKDIDSGKVDPETHEEAQLSVQAAQKSRDAAGRNAKGFRDQGGMGGPDNYEEEEQWHQDNMKRADQEVEKREKKLEPFAKMKSKYVARTGKELNQETITVDGKQFRRINESVEKQPKPKYEFSEFYERFKK